MIKNPMFRNNKLVRIVRYLACLVIVFYLLQIQFMLRVNSKEAQLFLPAREVETKQKDYKLGIPEYFETSLYSDEEIQKLWNWMEELQNTVKKNWRVKAVSKKELNEQQPDSSTTVYNFLVDKYGNLKEIRQVFNNAKELITNSTYEALVNSSGKKSPPVFSEFSDDQAVVEFNFKFNVTNTKEHIFTKDEEVEMNNKSKKFFLELTNVGNPFITYTVGTYYRHGIVPFTKDLDLAKKYIEGAANDGYIPAINYLAVIQIYEIPQPSKQKILEQFTKAAQEGFISSQINLGRLYYHGKLVERNLEKSRFWYERAANAGSTLAQKELKFLNEEVEKKVYMTLIENNISS